MTLAFVWFTLLTVLSFGIAYTSFAEIRSDGNLPGSPTSAIVCAIAILLTWEEIGGVVAKTIWGFVLPHDAGSSVALITAILLTALAVVATMIAPNVCASLLWRSAAAHSQAAK